MSKDETPRDLQRVSLGDLAEHYSVYVRKLLKITKYHPQPKQKDNSVQNSQKSKEY